MMDSDTQETETKEMNHTITASCCLKEFPGFGAKMGKPGGAQQTA